MADRDGVHPCGNGERTGGEEQETGGEERERGGLTEAQGQVLDRCLHALQHAKNDSHVLAALLLISRLCPASQLDMPTLRRIFEAVGIDLPARLLVTAVRGSADSGLPPYELLSLGSALLAALSTDPDMASHPQLLATVPVLLGILANDTLWKRQNRARSGPEYKFQSAGENPANDTLLVGDGGVGSSRLDEALAADCYQVLMAVCALPMGPEQLLSRGAVPGLCRALDQNQTLSQQRGLPLLGHLLSGKTRERAWSRHPAELFSLLLRLCRTFCQTSDQNRLQMCSQLVQFLPPAGVAAESEELRGAVRLVWGALRPLLQAKLTARQIGSVLVLSACLLDFSGWDLVGPPKFCCLLVNRACVEVRMGLEEPPGTQLSLELQQTLTGCYRIMEAAMERVCVGDAGSAAPPHAAPPHASSSTMSLQQSRQVLEVLEEAFSAVMYHLQQVGPGCYGNPFIFASFRSLCSWLAEETSCLKQEVTRLMPFLIGYACHHLDAGRSEQGLIDWMSRMSVDMEGGAKTGTEALRYLLPALCHLSAEEGPRKVLLTLDTPTLLVDFLSQTWSFLRKRSSSAWTRDPSMETASSTLLNFTVTEPESVRTEPCFRTLEVHLSDALPVLVNKPRLLVLAANYCTLGMMMSRLRTPPTGSVDAGQRRFVSAALRFLRSAVDSGPVQVGSDWAEAAELCRLSLQALGSCVRTQFWIPALLRDDGWLRQTLAALSKGGTLLDRNTEEVLEDVLCAAAEQCPACRQDIADVMKTSDDGALSRMKRLRKVVDLK